MSFLAEYGDIPNYRDLFLDGNGEELENLCVMGINKFLDENKHRSALTAIYWFWMHKMVTSSEDRRYTFSNVEKVIEEFLSSTENSSNKDHYYYWDLLTSSWSHLPNSHFIDIPNWILEIQKPDNQSGNSSQQTAEEPSWKRARTNNNKTLGDIKLSSNGRLAFTYLLAMIHHNITKLNLIDSSKSAYPLFVNLLRPLIDTAETHAGIALYWLDFMEQKSDSEDYSIDLIVDLLKKDEA